MPSRSPRRRSYRPPGRASAGAFALAALAGTVGGLAVVVASLMARVTAEAHTGDWIATAAPAVAVAVAAALAVVVHRACKIAERSPTIALATLAAAPALLTGYVARLFDTAALLDEGAIAGWSLGVDWLQRVALEDVVAAAPGLRRVAEAFGADAAWVALACELVVLAAMIVTAVDLALQAPLCGACRRWCRRAHGVVVTSAPEPVERLEERAVARDWVFFRGLGDPGGRRRLRFDLATCPTPSCDRSSAVSMFLVRTLRRDRPLVIDLRLGPDDLRTIAAMRRRRTQKPADQTRTAPDAVGAMAAWGMARASARRPR